MKKLMLFGFIVLQAFVFFANATTYLWKTSNFCYQNERIVLDTDFKIEIWGDDILLAKGTWEFDDDEGNAINAEVDVEGRYIVLHLRVTEKGRGLGDRYSSDRVVFIKAIEFNDAEYVNDESCR